jgi:hypothetical protein
MGGVGKMKGMSLYYGSRPVLGMDGARGAQLAAARPAPTGPPPFGATSDRKRSRPGGATPRSRCRPDGGDLSLGPGDGTRHRPRCWLSCWPRPR